MTYDPEQLRNLLLGGKPEEGDEADRKDEAKPVVPDSAAIPGKTNDRPAPVENAPVRKTAEVDSLKNKSGESPDGTDLLEKIRAEYFAPARNVIPESKGAPEETAAEKGVSREESRAGDSQYREIEQKKENKGSIESREAKLKPARKPRPVLPPSPLSMLCLWGAGLSLLGALVILAVGKVGTAPIMLIGIGTVLGGGFLFANRLWIRSALSSRNARYSANVSIAIVSLLGIMVLFNVLAYRYHYRLDLSATGLNSLSSQSLKVLEDIDRAGENVTITAFVPASSPARKVIENTIDPYLYRSNKLQFSFVDPDVKRELTESKKIDKVPSVLFELGNRRMVASDLDEAHFTSALMGVRQTYARVASFVTGHGEPDPFSDDTSQTGLSLFRKRLELDNFQVGPLNIPQSNGIPAETSLLIIVAPQRDLEPQEISQIGQYLGKGGNLMVLLEPGHPAGLTDMLAQYGIAVNNDIVLDDENNYYGDFSSPIAMGNPKYPITENFDNGVLFLKAGSLDNSSSMRLSGVEVESVIRSSASSWSEETDEYVFDEDVDKRESREMALLALRKIPGASDSSSDEQKIAHVLVVNDSSFVQNANFDSFLNRDFVLNAANFVVEGQALMAFRSADRGKVLLDLSAGQRMIVMLFSLILTPVFIAGLGVWVWIKRK